MSAPGPMSTRIRLLDGLVRIEDPDPALIPLQNDALKRVKDAHDHGTHEDIRDAVRVARELGALP